MCGGTDERLGGYCGKCGAPFYVAKSWAYNPTRPPRATCLCWNIARQPSVTLTGGTCTFDPSRLHPSTTSMADYAVYGEFE